MELTAPPGADERQRFYEDFSLAVGLRDWLVPNPRHEQLKLHIDDVLRGRRGLKILDVGCGAGVMTAHLRRYGDVTGTDFSAPAIAAARGLAPGVRFLAGTLDALPSHDRFDVVAMFDVLEHIPARDRPAFLSDVRSRLVDRGLVFVSTPFPEFTRNRRARGDDTLQVVDEEVELPALTVEAAQTGLQLLRFEAYDVFGGSPEYQVMVFTTARAPGGPPALLSRRLQRRLRVLRSPAGRRLRKAWQAGRLAAAGHVDEARWLLTATPPDVRS
jgi:SAM-dependent methyltransferase